MCGRFVSATPPDELAAYFGATVAADALAPNFNVAPTADVYAVVETPHGRELQVFHWGLVPAWAKEVKIGQKMINARAETIATKPAFKSVFRKHRCIVPVDGFYEWQVVPGLLNRQGKPAKQPVYIHRVDGEPLAFAGMWSAWRDPAAEGPDAPRLHSATIITTSANGDISPVHDRMPVLLPASRWAEWLDPANTDTDTLGRLLVPAPDGLLTFHTVSTDVNNVRNRGEHLREPAPPLAGPDAAGGGEAPVPADTAPESEGRLL